MDEEYNTTGDYTLNTSGIPYLDFANDPNAHIKFLKDFYGKNRPCLFKNVPVDEDFKSL